MSKLSKMSVEKIIRQVGLNVSRDQLVCLIKDTTPLTKVDMSKEFAIEEIVKFLIDNNDNIIKEKLVYIIAKNTKKAMREMVNKDLDEIERIHYKRHEICYESCLELLGNVEVEFPVFQEKDGIITIKEFWTMDDLIGGNRKKKNENERKTQNARKLNKVEEQLPLEYFFLIGSLADFENFVCYYEGNGSVFQNVVMNNASKRLLNFVIEEEKEGRNVEEDSEEFRSKKFMLLLEEVKKVMLQNPEKFDIEKFLLISAYREKDLLESYHYDELDELEKQHAIKIMQVAHELIENPKLKITGNIIILHNGKNKRVDYSTEMLAEDIKKIVNGKYYSKMEVSEEKRKIIEGEIDLGKVASPEYLDVLKFSLKEKRELIEKNPKNLEYLSILGELEPGQIQESLSSIEEFKFDFIFIDSLYRNGVINKKDIVDMYMKNNMDLSRVLNMNEEHDLQPEITVEELMKYYEEMKQDEEKTGNFDRYSLLFRELKIKGRTPEVRDEIAEQIAMKVCESDTEYEDFKNLYEANLLPIKTLIEWNDDDIIYDLIKNRALKPKDARSLLMSGSLDLSKVHKILQESNLSNEEKLNFIYSSFNGVGENPEEIKAQNEARMYLIQGLNISNELVKIEKTEQITTRKAKNENTKKIERNRYVSDPIYRWQLFSELDEDCDIKLYKDGTAKVTLPDLNQVIFEKLFKYKKGETTINYGAATYIMSQEEFDKNKANIILDEKINRKALVEMQEAETANKLVHSLKWGKALKENLDISPENGYSKEKIERIDNLVDKIEKARELMD